MVKCMDNEKRYCAECGKEMNKTGKPFHEQGTIWKQRWRCSKCENWGISYLQNDEIKRLKL